MHQEFLTIQSLLHYALNTPGHQGKGVYIVGTVSTKLAERIALATGLQVPNYRITIDHSAIIHAFRQHGQPMEPLRGQVIVNETDVLTLANWLLVPTQVLDAGQFNGQLRCLRFELLTPTTHSIAILEVRTGRNRQQLALKTLYKKKASCLSN